jgi:acylphosphatase
VERLHAVVHGEVQGVGFRYFLTARARSMRLRGWVRNRADGTVEFLAEGARGELDQLLDAARRGPGHARVDDVDAEWSPATGGLEPFDLIY